MTMKRAKSAQLIASLGMSVALLGGSISAEVEAAPTARAIMEKVAVTRKLDGSEAVVKMRIVNAKGQAREREMAMASKLYDGGKTEKRIYRFLSPPDVKGTGVLVFDYETKDDDVWLFLPALRKTRRIVSSKRSKSFMGSEFSYADLNVPALDDYSYRLAKEESFEGTACWVIEVQPKNDQIAKDEGYSRKTYWVSKAKHTVRRGMFYDLGGKLLKEFRSKDIKLLDPKKKRYRAMYMEMTNRQNGRKSVFESTKAVFSPTVKDDLFTSRHLERP